MSAVRWKNTQDSALLCVWRTHCIGRRLGHPRSTKTHEQPIRNCTRGFKYISQGKASLTCCSKHKLEQAQALIEAKLRLSELGKDNAELEKEPSYLAGYHTESASVLEWKTKSLPSRGQRSAHSTCDCAICSADRKHALYQTWIEKAEKFKEFLHSRLGISQHYKSPLQIQRERIKEQ